MLDIFLVFLVDRDRNLDRPLTVAQTNLTIFFGTHDLSAVCDSLESLSPLNSTVLALDITYLGELEVSTTWSIEVGNKLADQPLWSLRLGNGRN